MGAAFIEKVKIWFKKTGFTNIVYLGLAIGTPFAPLGLIGLAFLKPYLVGAFIGIFCYLNWNLIVKLWNTNVKDAVEDKIDEIKENIKK